MRILVALALVAACGGDDSMNHADAARTDASFDAPNGLDPVRATFAPIQGELTSPPTDWFRGPGNKLYADRASTLVVSDDDGATWTGLTATTFAPVATSASLFVVRNGPVLARSSNGGASFTDLTVPGLAGNTRMALAATPTALWVETQTDTDPSKLFRSTTEGDAFTEVTPPTSTSALLMFTVAGEHVFVHDAFGHIWRTTDGATWDDLGIPVAGMYPYVGASAAGTVFVGDQRRALADTDWSTVGTSTYAMVSQRDSGELVRVGQQGGAVETSNDDGVTWSSTSVATIPTCSVGESRAFDGVVLAICVEASQSSLLRLPAAALAWSRAEPDTLPAGIRPVAISFTSAGRIFVASSERIYASDDATHWHRLPFVPDDGWPIRAMAVSPSGTHIYVGSTVARYAFLDATGAVAAQSTMPIDAMEVPNAAEWMSDEIVYVTTSSPDDYKGHLLNGDPDRITVWEPVNPYRNEVNPQQITPAGYHGVQACGPLAVGARTWVSAQAYQAELRVQFQPSDPFTTVEQPYSPLPTISMSCATNGTHSFLIGDASNQFLYVGNFLLKFAPVEHDIQGALLAASFAPDNHLWVLSSFGIYRSNEAIDAH